MKNIVQIGDEFIVLYNVNKISPSINRKHMEQNSSTVATTDYYPACHILYSDHSSYVINLENCAYSGQQTAFNKAKELLKKLLT